GQEISVPFMQHNRREFIQHTAILAGGATRAAAPLLQAADANQKLILGLIGPGGMGMNHLRALSTYKDVELAYVCDPDEQRLNRAVADAQKAFGKAPKPVKDMRRVFDEKTVDAVFIATPDHWHAPAAIL